MLYQSWRDSDGDLIIINFKIHDNNVKLLIIRPPTLIESVKTHGAQHTVHISGAC